MQQPDLELIQVRGNESFKVWAHGYPYKTVRWHFHPEYELHLVTATTGTFRVGDYVGAFEPGNLVMTGPNLPHNWVSNVGPGEIVPERCLVLQFTQEFIQGCLTTFPELEFVAGLLEESTHGIGFPLAAATLVAPILVELLHAVGARRIALFVTLLSILGQTKTRVPLASGEFQSKPMKYMSGAMNHVLVHIRGNFTAELRESELAKLCGLSPSAFSRTFRKHTGMTFVPYINLLRIEYACQLLVNRLKSVTEICYEVGFNNVSNFNRQFLILKQTTPSKFRNTHTINAAVAASAA